VRVVAAGMDRSASHFMTGEPNLMRFLGFRASRPERRPDASGFEPGEEVYGVTRGTFADYALAPIDKVAPEPPQLSFEQAAVLPYPTSHRHQDLTAAKQRPGSEPPTVSASFLGLRDTEPGPGY
jgi:NADPH:quinone reductase-like Zn-dependent oxidoreductase